MEGTITTRRPKIIDWYLEMEVGVARNSVLSLLCHGLLREAYLAFGCISVAEELASHPSSLSEARCTARVAARRSELGDCERSWTFEERKRS